jgi:uncharacterized damage-inducible protein DinB
MESSRLTRISQIGQIVEELRCAFDGEAWHGPALMEILDGVDAKTAAARPIATAHSIWELVIHITGWERVVTRRLHGEKLSLSDDENFGHITDFNPAAWQRAVAHLRSTHTELLKVVASLPEERLKEQVPGKPYDIAFMLHGATQHTAYHGGQIALLKRARG